MILDCCGVIIKMNLKLCSVFCYFLVIVKIVCEAGRFILYAINPKGCIIRHGFFSRSYSSTFHEATVRLM